jgi:hypothetical protein
MAIEFGDVSYTYSGTDFPAQNGDIADVAKMRTQPASVHFSYARPAGLTKAGGGDLRNLTREKYGMHNDRFGFVRAHQHTARGVFVEAQQLESTSG